MRTRSKDGPTTRAPIACGQRAGIGTPQLVLVALTALTVCAVLVVAARSAAAVEIKGWKSPRASQYTNDLTAARAAPCGSLLQGRSALEATTSCA